MELHEHHLASRVLLILLLVGIFAALTFPPAAYSQYLPCNIVSLNITGPPTVPAGQTLQISTSITGACDPSMFYAIRVDLMDGRSQTVLSSKSLVYIPVTSSFVTFPIVNTVTAPTSLGFWPLQIQAYLLSGLNGAVVTSSSQLFTVNVVPYTPPTTTQPVTMNSTISLIETSTNSTTISTSQTTFITPNSTSTSTVEAPGNTNQTSTLLTVVAVIAILTVIIILMLTRRKHATTPKPQQPENVKYCSHCGTKVPGNDDFCSHCGTKQT